MAAGLGFKDFTTGEVLTAADVDGYLMQGIWVFANATARDAAVTSPQEGNFAFLKDTNVTTYYTGSAWANLDTTGMANPMTTTGDTIYSSSGSTPARLGIGTAGQVLQVNSGATAPEWATPAAGGMTLISTTTISNNATVSLTSIPQTYNSLYVVIRNYKPATAFVSLRMRFNSDNGSNRHRADIYNSAFYYNTGFAFNGTSTEIAPSNDTSVASGLTTITIPDYTNATTWKQGQFVTVSTNSVTTEFLYVTGTSLYNQTGAITSLDFFSASGNLTSGTILLYGVK